MTSSDRVPLHTEFNQPAPEGWREMDVVYPERAPVRIGLIALANDCAIETDLHDFLPSDDLQIHCNRVYSPQFSNLASLHAVGGDITESVKGLMPDSPLDVVAFGCTSATMALGRDTIEAAVLRARSDVQVVEPISAALAGLELLGCRKIALLTPYIGEVNVMVGDYITGHGFEVAAKGFFAVVDDDERSRIRGDAIEAAGLALAGDPAIDGLFISCTALRTAGVVESLERALGKPVVTSNQALAWDALRRAGDMRIVQGRGRLLREEGQSP